MPKTKVALTLDSEPARTGGRTRRTGAVSKPEPGHRGGAGRQAPAARRARVSPVSRPSWIPARKSGWPRKDSRRTSPRGPNTEGRRSLGGTRSGAGPRPGRATTRAVLSHDIFNDRSGTVIALALTSQEPRAGFPLTLESKATGTEPNAPGSRSASSAPCLSIVSAPGLPAPPRRSSPGPRRAERDSRITPWIVQRAHYRWSRPHGMSSA